jgi:hypothetical protein
MREIDERQNPPSVNSQNELHCADHRQFSSSLTHLGQKCWGSIQDD